MLKSVNMWIQKAKEILAKETHVPLIDDDLCIEMGDVLDEVWEYGDEWTCGASTGNVILYINEAN